MKKKYLVIIITNQSGIARKIFGHLDVKKLHDFLDKFLLNKKDAKIDDYFYCPHHPTEGFGVYKKSCYCRKPRPGMIKAAIKKWSISKKASFMIGDQYTDYQSALSSNIKFHYKKKNSLFTQIKKIIN